MTSMATINSFMTWGANRHYIQPMFFGVAFVVMVVRRLPLFTIRALEGRSGRKFTKPNQLIHGVARLPFVRGNSAGGFAVVGDLIRVGFSPFIVIVFNFSHVGLIPFFDGAFLLFGIVLISFPICFAFALSALWIVSVFAAFIKPKLSNQLWFFALRTFFIHVISNKIHPSIVQLSRLPQGAVNNQRVKWNYKAKTLQSNLDKFNYILGGM